MRSRWALPTDGHAVEFWVRHVRVGAALTAASAALGLLYCGLSVDRPNRVPMFLLLVVAILLTPVVLALPVERIVRSRWGAVFFLGWSGAVCVLVTVLGLIDGNTGLYGLLFVLALVFASTAYPPDCVVLVGAMATTGYVLVSAVHGSDLALSVCSAGCLVLSTAMGAVAARNRWQADERRRRDEARFAALFRHASDLVTLVEPDGTIRYQSPSITPLLGYRPDDLAGTSMTALVHAEDRSGLMEEIEHLLAGRLGDVARLQARVLAADGTWRHFEAVATNLVDDPDLGALVLTSRDVSDRVRLEAELRHSATHDPLTLLSNRSLLLDRVAEALAAPRPPGTELAVVFFDLDDFKTLNDSLGHAAGDEVLVVAASRLQASALPGATAARLGGDEFALLLPASGRGEVVQVAERVLAELARPAPIGEREVVLGASAGIAIAEPGTTASELLRDADAAMYAAKAAGKGVAAVFEPSMHADVLERLELKADLRSGLESGQLVLHYQPVVELATRRITGVEALLRWNHPERGTVAPAAFIPLAEETGLIVDIGRWVVGEACAQLARWDAEGVSTDLVMGVNVSARQLDDPSFVADVIDALRRAGLAPSRLTLEVTESRLLDDPEGTVRLGELRRLGVILAVDDFGTGYSSLSHLSRLPVDVLKVDRTFIASVTTGGAAMVGAILDLAAALGLRTVAEGVETEAEEAALQALPCTWGQGFLYSPAVPADAFAALVLRDAVAV